MKRISAFLFFGLVLAVQGFAQQDLQPVAIVRLTGSVPITVKQLRTEVERYERQANRNLTVDERRQILDQMINERLLVQAAERDRVTVTDNDINQQLQQLRGIMANAYGRQPTDAEFAAAIKNEYGMEMPAFREHLKMQLLFQKYMMEKKGDQIAGLASPSEAEVQNYFRLNRATMFVRPETVGFSIISVPFTDAASKVRARETADRLLREIGGDPSKFDEVKARGQTPNAGYNSGDGGYLPNNSQAEQRVGKEFMDVAFSLKLQEVSRVIENVQGFQIIRITANHPMKILELDDLIQFGANMTVRDYIVQGLLQQSETELLQRLTQELFTDLRRGNPYQVMEANLNW